MVYLFLTLPYWTDFMLLRVSAQANSYNRTINYHPRMSKTIENATKIGKTLISDKLSPTTPIAPIRYVPSRSRGCAVNFRWSCPLPNAQRFPLAGHRPWTKGDVALWGEVLKTQGILRHGAKSKLKTADPASEVTVETLRNILEPEALDSLAASWAGDYRDLLSWWQDRLLGEMRNRAEFPALVAAKRGPLALAEEPGVIVGTIHSAKGGEADDGVSLPGPEPSRGRAIPAGRTVARPGDLSVLGGRDARQKAALHLRARE